MARQLGALLTLLRERQGYSQKDLADKLCEMSGQMTVTRHEVSRWEREERVPTNFWLGWLSKVLEAPVSELAEARARSKGEDKTVAEIEKVPEKVTGTKWRDYARSIRERSLALVSLKFEHRSTSVQLSATYEEPERATAAIGMFRQMVAPGAAGRTDSEQGAAQTGANGLAMRSSTAHPSVTNGGAGTGAGVKPAEVAPASSATAPRTGGGTPATAPSRPRVPTPAGATSNGSTPVRVPMGIRYTTGPGVENGNGRR